MLYLGYLLLIIGLLVHYKIFYWIKTCKIGLRSETPEIFLKNQKIYELANIIFFIIVLIYSGVSWYFVVILYIATSIPVSIFANKKYDEIVRKLKEDK